MTRHWILTLIFVLGCRAATHAPPREQKVEFLLRQQLPPEIAANREVILQRARIPPNTMVRSHWHPSETFHYYLQGEAKIHLPGGETLDRRAGQVSHIPLKSIHSVLAGPSGATILVFRVHLEGKPVRYDGEADSPNH